MHSSYFSTNDYLLDQAVGKYWTNRADAIARRKAAKEEEATDNSFELTEEEAKRFEDKVERGEGDQCDVWVAGKNEQGYGQFRLRGRRKRAHVIAWQHANNRLANPSRSMVIAHICEVKGCVRPSHLDEQSAQQNLLYADNSLAAMHRAKTHCPKGHSLIEGNCQPGAWAQGSRKCIICLRERNALFKAAHEALGITQREYAILYGRGQAAAVAIADNPNCEAEHRKKQAE
jgi:hypothetical protein